MKIFESMGDEVTNCGYVLQTDRLLYMYTAAIIVSIAKSARLRVA